MFPSQWVINYSVYLENKKMYILFEIRSPRFTLAPECSLNLGISTICEVESRDYMSSCSLYFAWSGAHKLLGPGNLNINE